MIDLSTEQALSLSQDSNGQGGLHLRGLLRGSVDTPRVRAYFLRLTDDHARYGLKDRPEVFPKQWRVGADRCPYGNWLRLPGRHHTKEHWSRVWNGERGMEGAEAVACMLSVEGDDPGLLPAWNPFEQRILAYIAKLPAGLGEGQHRDDYAYQLGCFIVRDLKRPDDEALHWMNRWDAGNLVPKGPERLREILANVHQPVPLPAAPLPSLRSQPEPCPHMLTEPDIPSRIQRLDVLVDGFAREVDAWRNRASPLTVAEQRHYLDAIQDALAGVYAARVVLAKVLGRIAEEAMLYDINAACERHGPDALPGGRGHGA
jgi:hypothetical protein